MLMATISAYDSASIGVLFSSLNSSSSNSSSSMGSLTSDILGISYSDYASIKSGSYFKLMKAYYGEGLSSEVTEAVSTSTSKDDTKTLARIESSAEDLKESADALLEKGTDSLFKTKTVTGEDGKAETVYDTEAIYKAVNKFVDDYNSLVSVATDAKTSNISSAAERLTNLADYNEKALEKIGITINEDNELEIDKETFMGADMQNVKNLFQERASFAYQVSTQASMINYYAENEASKSNTYGSSGTYTYNYNTGTLYNEVI